MYLTDTPSVGDGITISGWSDAHAYTVIEVSPSGKTILAQRDKATRTNRQDDIVTPGGFAAHTESPKGQQWDYEADPEGNIIKLTKRSDGFYRQVGVTYRQGGARVGRHEYYDYNF